MGLNKTTYSIKPNPLESNSNIGNKTIFLKSGNKIELFDSANIGEEQLEEIKFLINKDDFNSGFYNIQGEDFFIQKDNGNFLVFPKTTENFSEKNILKQILDLREKYILYTKEVNDFLEEHKLQLLNILGDEEQNKQKIANKKQQIFDEVKKIVLEIKNLNSEELQKSLLEDLGKAIEGQVDLSIIEKEVESKNTKITNEENQDIVEIPEWLKGTGLKESSEDSERSKNTETSLQSDKKQKSDKEGNTENEVKKLEYKNKQKISQEDYDKFIKTGEVSDEILNYLVGKIINNEEIKAGSFEHAFISDMETMKKINDKIREIKEEKTEENKEVEEYLSEKEKLELISRNFHNNFDKNKMTSLPESLIKTYQESLIFAIESLVDNDEYKNFLYNLLIQDPKKIIRLGNKDEFEDNSVGGMFKSFLKINEIKDEDFDNLGKLNNIDFLDFFVKNGFEIVINPNFKDKYDLKNIIQHEIVHMVHYLAYILNSRDKNLIETFTDKNFEFSTETIAFYTGVNHYYYKPGERGNSNDMDRFLGQIENHNNFIYNEAREGAQKLNKVKINLYNILVKITGFDLSKPQNFQLKDEIQPIFSGYLNSITKAIAYNLEDKKDYQDFIDIILVLEEDLYKTQITDGNVSLLELFDVLTLNKKINDTNIQTKIDKIKQTEFYKAFLGYFKNIKDILVSNDTNIKSENDNKNPENQTEDDDNQELDLKQREYLSKVNNDRKTIKKAILKGDEIIELEMSYENGEDETNKKILDENKYYFVGEFDGKFIYEKQKSALNILLPKRIKKLISQTTKQVLNTISLPRMASKFKIELENGSILIYFDKNGKLLEKSESFEKVDSIIRTIRNNLEKAYKKFIQGEDIENVFPEKIGKGIKNREEFLKQILKEFIKGKLSIGVLPKIVQKFSKEVLENLKQEDQEETGGLRKKIKTGFNKYFGFGPDEEENEKEIKEDKGDKEEGGNTDSSFEDFVLEKDKKAGVLKNIFSRKNNSETKDNFDYNNIDLSQYTEKYKTEKNENILKIKVKFDILQDILFGKKDKKLFDIFSKKLENGIDLGGGVILGEKEGKVTYFRKNSDGVLEEDTSIKGNLKAGQKARFLEEMGFLDNDFIDKRIKEELEEKEEEIKIEEKEKIEDYIEKINFALESRKKDFFSLDRLKKAIIENNSPNIENVLYNRILTFDPRLENIDSINKIFLKNYQKILDFIEENDSWDSNWKQQLFSEIRKPGKLLKLEKFYGNNKIQAAPKMYFNIHKEILLENSDKVEKILEKFKKILDKYIKKGVVYGIKTSYMVSDYLFRKDGFVIYLNNKEGIKDFKKEMLELSENIADLYFGFDIYDKKTKKYIDSFTNLKAKVITDGIKHYKNKGEEITDEKLKDIFSQTEGKIAKINKKIFGE